MSTTNTPNDEPMYPLISESGMREVLYPGATIRDMYMVHILQGLCANPDITCDYNPKDDPKGFSNFVAGLANAIADEAMKVRGGK